MANQFLVVDLGQEPLVSGIPEMIDELVADIPNARQGFRLLFSADPFPGYQPKMTRLREDMGGWWYKSDEPDGEGWLCPALFRYFDEAEPAPFTNRRHLRTDAIYEPAKLLGSMITTASHSPM